MERKIRDFDSKEVKDVLVKLTKLIVDVPENVDCFVNESPNSTMFELSVDATDYGKLVGKNGQMAIAFRTIMRAIAGTYDKRLLSEISFSKK